MVEITVSFEKQDDWECCCGDPAHTKPGQWSWVARADGHSSTARTAEIAKKRVQYMLDCRDHGLWPSP